MIEKCNPCDFNKFNRYKSEYESLKLKENEFLKRFYYLTDYICYNYIRCTCKFLIKKNILEFEEFIDYSCCDKWGTTSNRLFAIIDDKQIDLLETIPCKWLFQDFEDELCQGIKKYEDTQAEDAEKNLKYWKQIDESGRYLLNNLNLSEKEITLLEKYFIHNLK